MARPKLGSGKRFAQLKAKIASRGGVRDPGAVAAAIGRKKFGKKKFQQLSAHGRTEKALALATLAGLNILLRKALAKGLAAGVSLKPHPSGGSIVSSAGQSFHVPAGKPAVRQCNNCGQHFPLIHQTCPGCGTPHAPSPANVSGWKRVQTE